MLSFQSVFQVWYPNLKVWKKLAAASLLGNVIDPIMALMAFGLGLGSMIADVDGKPYLNWGRTATALLLTLAEGWSLI